jgi:uncharacterized repeat protein (TIGR03803 family)
MKYFTVALLLVVVSSYGQEKIFIVTSKGGAMYGGTLASFDPDGGNLKVDVNFGRHLKSPAPLNLQGNDGFLYSLGYDARGAGIFKIRPNGIEYQQILAFKNDAFDDEGLSDGALVLSNGVIYGSTHLGGSHSSGVVFRVNEDGTNYKRLHNFKYAQSAVVKPATMVLGSDGFLYGTNHVGAGLDGVIYSVATDGSAFKEVLDFHSVDMRQPYDLIQGANGKLYGLCLTENNGWVVLFRVNNDGTGFEVIHLFSDGDNPAYGIRQAADGTIYGVLVNGDGAIFTCLPDGTDYKKIYTFTTAAGTIPSGKIVQAEDGFLYGRTLSVGSNGMGTTFRILLDGSAFEVLSHSTLAGISSPPMLDESGIVYGLASGGGQFNGGAVYNIQSGSEQVVYDFGGADLTDYYLSAGLTNVEGNMLTMANSFVSLGSTMIVGLSANRSLITHSLSDTARSSLMSRPVLGSDGFLYVVNEWAGEFHTGTIFKCKPDGSSYGVVHNFSSLGGINPVGTLLVGLDGRLYGTCFRGGNYNFGVIYSVNLDGTGYTVLHHFNNPTGVYPRCGLIQSSDGTLFGSARNLFSIRPDGTNYKELFHFKDNERKYGELTLEAAYLYGALTFGGSNSNGAIFRMKTNGSDYTILHHFNGMDGSTPASTLLPYAGAFYGTTSAGGAFGFGTVYKLDASSGGFTKIMDLSLKTGAFPMGDLMGICVPTAKPIVTISGTTLASSAALGNQWFRNGVIIPGADGITYEPSSAGVYSVAAGFSGCISPMSDGVMVNVTGLENEFPQGLVKFFPNPTNNLLFVHANSHAVIENVSISDAMGNLIVNHDGVIGPEWYYDMSRHSGGVYIIKAFVDGRQTYTKVLRN